MMQWLASPFAVWGNTVKSAAAVLPAPVEQASEAPAESISSESPHCYRAIFISDIHLGTRGCKADYLLDFLRSTESDSLYLVGDIIDGWALRKELLLASNAQRCHSESLAQSSEGNTCRLRARQPRRSGPRICRAHLWRHRDLQRCGAHASRWTTPVGGSRRFRRRRDSARKVVGAHRRLAVRLHLYGSTVTSTAYAERSDWGTGRCLSTSNIG